jgi:hypothetical protein
LSEKLPVERKDVAIETVDLSVLVAKAMNLMPNSMEMNKK